MRSVLSAVLLVATLFLGACGKSAAPRTAPAATRSAGPAATGPAIAQGPRIISTVPAATLNLVLIGAGDTLVGVSTYDSVYLPENDKNLPIVGDYENMNYEELITLQPTAVIVQRAPSRIPERLRDLAAAHHFAIINIKLQTIGDLWDTVKILGKAAGKEGPADLAILKAQRELKELAASLKGKPRPRVVYAISKDPMDVVGGDNFMDQILTLAGADNIAASIGNGYSQISTETLVKLAPDVLLVSAPAEPEQQRDDPRLEFWRRLPTPAAKNNRIYLVTDPDALTASVDLPRNVRALSALIHKNAADSDGGGSKP